MHKPTLLFSEENDTNLSWKLLEREDIHTIYIRFLNGQFFSAEYLGATKDKLIFDFDKKAPIENEVKKFSEFAKKNKVKVDYFYNSSEFNQVFVQELAFRLGLEGSLSPQQALWVRDKPTMKDKIRSIGYNTVEYAVVKSAKDVVKFAKSFGGFPVVVKWRSGLSSIDVYKVHNEKELLKLDLDYSTGKYMVESFCADPVWGIDAIVKNGRVVKTFIILLPFDNNLSFTDGKNRFAQVTLPKRPPELKFDDVKMTQDLISGIGLNNGYISFESFIDSNGQPTIGELAWRPTGEYCLLNHGEAFGIDLYSALLDVIVGKKIDPIPEIGHRCVGDMFLPLKNGVISSITSFSEISDQPGVINGEVTYVVGDTVRTKRKYNDIAGWVQVQGKNRKELLSRMDNIYKIYNITTQPNF